MFQNPMWLSFRGLLRARSRFPKIIGIIRKQEQRRESLEPGLVLAKQVLSPSIRTARNSASVGALLVHYNLQMRLSRCNWEQLKVLKTIENRWMQTGQVGLAINRPMKVRFVLVWLVLQPLDFLFFFPWVEFFSFSLFSFLPGGILCLFFPSVRCHLNPIFLWMPLGKLRRRSIIAEPQAQIPPSWSSGVR